MLLWFVFGQLSCNLKRLGTLETLEAFPSTKLWVSFLLNCILKPEWYLWFRMAKSSILTGIAELLWDLRLEGCF